MRVQVMVEVEADTLDEAKDAVRGLLTEANESTFGWEPVYLVGEYPEPLVAPYLTDAQLRQPHGGVVGASGHIWPCPWFYSTQTGDRACTCGLGRPEPHVSEGADRG